MHFNYAFRIVNNKRYVTARLMVKTRAVGQDNLPPRRLLCCLLHALALRVHPRCNRRNTGCACCSPVQFAHKFLADTSATAFGKYHECHVLKIRYFKWIIFTKWRGHIPKVFLKIFVLE